MRCSPKLCIGIIVVGIGAAALLAYSGNPRAAYILSLLPFLACPLMCVAMMMFGRDCHDGSRQKHAKVQRTQSLSPQTHENS